MRILDKDFKNYNKLFSLSREAETLAGIFRLLEWDQETLMPPGAVKIRSQQRALLAELFHKKKTSKSYHTVLSKLIDIDSGDILATTLTQRQKVALQRWRRDFIKAKALPNRFVKAFAKLTSEAVHCWEQAKSYNDFREFSPMLRRIIDMCRKKADFLGYKHHPYDALIDEFEPDMTTERISNLFNEIRDPITALLRSIVTCKQVDDSCLHGNFSEELQKTFAYSLLKTIGFSMEHGRLDLSVHPFCSSSHPSDCRLTTRIHPHVLHHSILAVIHEAGHSLYEMNLPPEEYGSPLCEAISMGFHESQSRLYETRIGLSQPFWQHFLPKLQDIFKGNLNEISLDTFYRAINKVTPSLIRIEADEVTYPLHVILRFELEKALIEGSAKVNDIPDLWNAKMQQYLGIRPDHDAEGCLQDIHWASGLFGYFPTYTLGNLYAAQLFTSFEAAFPSWKENIARGEFNFVKSWLNDNVHQYGRQYSSEDLLKKITGEHLSSKPYLQYLQTKYNDIYAFE